VCFVGTRDTLPDRVQLSGIINVLSESVLDGVVDDHIADSASLTVVGFHHRKGA